MDRVKSGSILRIGCLNVRGLNSEGKREEVSVVCKERNLDIMALTETKLKGKGEVNFGDFKGMISGVDVRVRAREGVAIVMKEEWWEKVVESKMVNSRLMWVRVIVGKEKWVFVCAYAPVSGSDERVREEFWEKLDECLGGFGVRDRICVLGDLNARVGNTIVRDVVGPFGVGGINENGTKLVEMCIARELIIGNTWFKKRLIHKFTWVSGVNGERALLDYVCLEQKVKNRLIDVNVLRGAAMGISDHFLVEAKLKVGKCLKRYRRECVNVEIVRVEKLENVACAREYERALNVKWENVRKNEAGEVEDEWLNLKGEVKNIANHVCGVRRVGGRRRKGSE